MSISPSAGASAGRHAADVATFRASDLPAEQTLEEAAPQAGAADAKAGPLDDVAELRQEIEQAREQLGDTVERLAAKADVKAQAKAKAAELADAVKSKVALAGAQAAARAGSARDQLAAKAGETGAAANSASNSARQQVVKVAGACAPVWQTAPEPVRHVVTKAASSARQRRIPIATAAGVLLLGCVVLRWWRRR
jgi:hypothetical protein